MTIKTKYNQVLVNRSNVKLSISQITQRLKFISEGNHTTKINKKMPNVEMAVKSIFLKPNSKVLILNSGVEVWVWFLPQSTKRQYFFFMILIFKISNFYKRI